MRLTTAASIQINVTVSHIHFSGSHFSIIISVFIFKVLYDKSAVLKVASGFLKAQWSTLDRKTMLHKFPQRKQLWSCLMLHWTIRTLQSNLICNFLLQTSVYSSKFSHAFLSRSIFSHSPGTSVMLCNNEVTWLALCAEILTLLRWSVCIDFVGLKNLPVMPAHNVFVLSAFNGQDWKNRYGQSIVWLICVEVWPSV